MKITYTAHVHVNVRYDNAFDYLIIDCPINEVQDKVEEQMWNHMFKTADIIDDETGEILMTIEKGYQSFSLCVC